MTPRTLLVALGTAVSAAALGAWVGPCVAADPEPRPEMRPQSVATPAKPEGNGTTGTATPPGLRCLTRAEQRARSAAHQVVPLAKAAQAVKAKQGELLRARLCEQNGRLVYLLTVLPRGGKLVRATVDAGTGTLVGGP
ncbi:PepSY domain-containing protein [Rhodoplanes roseus]|uniref:PepSY domain-containing protein n=1 Tax=Rhodoplanes roseus TaxID=29409 RepID=A0A327KUN0_9BRAD|nr:PepSY domain-containing protein [Rhodoplanes roseus]RAI42620.1 hypothetical protein CH341_18640 [Rhodoplanes roseus]